MDDFFDSFPLLGIVDLSKHIFGDIDERGELFFCLVKSQDYFGWDFIWDFGWKLRVVKEEVFEHVPDHSIKPILNRVCWPILMDS